MTSNGYVLSNGRTLVALQGRIDDTHYRDPFWAAKVARALELAGPIPAGHAVRAKFRAERLRGGRYLIDVAPGRLVELAAEAARLEALSHGNQRARTGSPGIVGYQEAERAATARLHNLRNEQARMAAALAGAGNGGVA